MPVLIPAPTTIGWQPRYFIIPLVNEYIIFGTTDAIITSVISEGLYPFCTRILQRSSPYSSEVLGTFTVNLNLAVSSTPLKTPNVISVFPTSTANNMFLSSSFLPVLVP